MEQCVDVIIRVMGAKRQTFGVPKAFFADDGKALWPFRQFAIKLTLCWIEWMIGKSTENDKFRHLQTAVGIAAQHPLCGFRTSSL